MSALAMDRRNFWGSGCMSLEWIPGAGIALLGSGLVFWRSTAVSAAHLEEKIAALRTELSEHKETSDEFEEAVTKDLHATFKELHLLIVKLEVLANNYATYTAMSIKTLESITRKLEAHDMAFMQQGQDIAILKSREQKG